MEAEDLLANESFKKWLLSPDAETAAYWESWLAEDPERADVIADAQAILRSLAFEERSLSEEDSKQMLAYVLQHRASETRVIHMFGRVPQWVRVAAVVSALVLTTVWLYSALRQPSNVLYTTGYGELKTVMLPDSSRVTINANSKLTIPDSWKPGQDREVWLEGEAFFEVLRKPRIADGHAKFTVHTQNLEVEVLGTRFNVKERATETRVVLNSGKVKLSVPALEAQAEVYMVPGESVEVLKHEKQKVRREFVNPSSYSSWVEHKLILDNTSVKEVTYLLKDIYGIDATFKDEQTALRSLNGTLPTNDKTALLNALSLALELEFVEHGTHVIFY